MEEWWRGGRGDLWEGLIGREVGKRGVTVGAAECGVQVVPIRWLLIIIQGIHPRWYMLVKVAFGECAYAHVSVMMALELRRQSPMAPMMALTIAI